jgi:hypothetical protein
LLIVLGRKNNEGRVAYVGPPSGLLAHFQCQNLADLYEKLDDGRFDVAGGDAPTRDDGPSGLDAQAVSTPVPGVTFVAPKHDSGEVAPSKRLKTKQLASPPNLTPWTQLAMICERAGLLIQRDTQLIASLAIQPVVLGLLVCLTQYNASRLVSLLLFAIVIAIWLGLNNSARELVRERKHYIRDRLAGLQPSVYLAGKVIVHSVIGAAQIVLLLLVIRVVAVPLLDAVGRKPQADDLRHTSFLWLFLVLTTCYVGALGMGLTISALVKTQETAVAVLPMLIMPQLLISVVGTLQIEEVYSSRAEPRPFRPLLAKLHADESLPMAAAGLDLASLVCLTRPAVLLAVKPAPSVPPEVGKAFWLVDLLHLLILVQAIWVSTWLAFTWAEQRWAGEPDVG